MCQQLGWRMNLEKSELEPNQDFDFVGYQFDFRSDRFRPTLDWVQNLQETVETAIPTGLPGPGIHVLDRLLTSTEKHVNLGRLHMRPIQWHLKTTGGYPESLQKVIQVPRSLHPHLQWRLKEDNALTGQPLHPIKHALQIFTDASIEGWGAHLDEHLARATWSPPGSKWYI